jgi:hypothetical protein
LGQKGFVVVVVVVVATNRLNFVADHIVKPTQTAFLRGRNILEGVVILQETIHKLHLKKQSGVILKIDFEKAYDKVKWPFMFQTLRMKGFSSKWISWMKSFVTGGSVAINVNDEVGYYFQTRKGLRQGDTLSPLLFNLVADMLAILIHRAKADRQIVGVVPHLVGYSKTSICWWYDFIYGPRPGQSSKHEALVMCVWASLRVKDKLS